jgi:hypothetical protein
MNQCDRRRARAKPRPTTPAAVATPRSRRDDVAFHTGVVVRARQEGTGVMLSAGPDAPDGRFDRYLSLFQASVALLD